MKASVKIKRLAYFIQNISVVMLLLCSTISTAQSASGPMSFNLGGGLFNPNGTPVLNPAVDFKVEVLDPSGACVLYSEEHIGMNLQSSKGGFALQVGTGSNRSNLIDTPNATALSLKIFKNDGLVNPAMPTCPGLTLSTGQTRLIRVSFNTGTGYTAMTPDVPITSASYSMIAETLEGKHAADFVQIRNDGTHQLTQTNIESLFENTAFGRLSNILQGSAPTDPGHAVTKGYADANVAGKNADVSALGPATGGYILAWDAVTSKWVAQAPNTTDSTKLPLAGGSMSGSINMGGNDITSVGDVLLAAQKFLGLGKFTDAQEGALTLGGSDSGRVWYNSNENILKVWNGTAAMKQAYLVNDKLQPAWIADNSIKTRNVASSVLDNQLLITGGTMGADIEYASCGENEVLKYNTMTGWTCANVSSLSSFPVTSVNGKTGAVVLNAADLSLGTASLEDVGSNAGDIPQLDAGARIPSIFMPTNMGDIQSITVSGPLTGGGLSGAISIGIDVGTGANQVVQLTGSGKLPAVDGSDLTGVNAVKLQTRDVSSVAPAGGQVLTYNGSTGTWEPRTDAGTGTVTAVVGGTGLNGGTITSTGTLSVNVGTGANQIVQMTASAKLPAVDGSDLTGVNAVKLQTRDIAATAPSGGQVLTYNGSSGAWEPRSDAGGSVTQIVATGGILGGTISTSGTISVDTGTLANQIVQMTGSQRLPAVDGRDLANVNAVRLQTYDVAAATPGAGQVLTWNGLASEWQPLALPAGNIGDVTEVAVTSGLTGGGTVGALTIGIDSGTLANQMVRMTASAKLPGVDGSDLTGVNAVRLQTRDISAAAPGGGQVLTFNSSTNVWEPRSDAGGSVTQIVASTGLNGGAITSTGTISVNVGTLANQIVQMTASQRLPAVDGRDLYNLNASNLQTYPISTAAPANAQVLTWNGSTSAWQPLALPAGNAGDVTEVAVTSGLTGGGTAGNLTIGIDSGTLANQILRMTASAKLPAVDGSDLTGVNAVKLQTRDVSAAAPGGGQVLTYNSSTNVWEPRSDAGGSVTQIVAGTGLNGGTISTTGTISVNAGTLANQIVQLDGSARLPALDGRNLTAVDAATIRTFSVAATTPSNAQVMTWNGSASQWQPLALPAGNAGDVTEVAVTSGLTGGGTAGNLTIGIDAGTLANQIVRMTASARLPSVDGRDVYNVNASTLQTYQVSAAAPGNAQVLTWNGSTSLWQPLALPAGNTGDVTEVAVTSGLTGGGAAGALTIGIDAGTSANQIVRMTGSARLPAVDGSDLSGINAVRLQSRDIAATAPVSGQILAYNGLSSAWEPKTDSAMGTVTQIVASTGLTGGTITGSGTVAVNVGTLANQIVQLDGSARIPALDGRQLINVDATTIRSFDVAATTPANAQVMTWNSSASQWQPLALPAGNAGDVTEVAVTSGLTGGGTAGNLTIGIDAGTAANQIVRMTGSARLPAVDGGDLTNVSAVRLQAHNISAVAPASGQVLAYNGLSSVWEARTDSATGTVTQIVASTGLTGGTITGSGTLAVNVGTTANQIVQLDGSARLPALDGRALTNVDASTIRSFNVVSSAPANAQVMTWNGSLSSWEPQNIAAANNSFIQGGNSFGFNATLGTNDNYSLSLKTNNVERLTVGSTGRVGIGTTLPGTALEVVGTIASSGSAVVVQNSGNTRATLGMSGGHGIVSLANTSNVANVFLHASGNSYLNGGNVSVGTTLANSRLTIQGALSLAQQGSDPAGTASYATLYTKSDGKLYYRDGAGAVVDLSAGATGNATQLQTRAVAATAPTADQILTWNGLSSAWEPRDAGVTVAGTANGQLQFKSGSALAANANLIWNNTTSRLGIGTADPQEKLEVAGDIAFGAARTNNTIKKGELAIPHYDSSRADVGILYMDSKSLTNELLIGSGNIKTGPTSIEFYTHTNNWQTVTGSVKMRMDSNGVAVNAPLLLNQRSGDPTGLAAAGAVYTKSDGKLYYRDGVGTIADISSGTRLQSRNVAAAAPTANQVLSWNGSLSQWEPQTVATGATPGGADGELQFKSGTGFAADSNLFWNNTSKRLGLGTSSPQYRFEATETYSGTASKTVMRANLSPSASANQAQNTAQASAVMGSAAVSSTSGFNLDKVAGVHGAAENTGTAPVRTLMGVNGGAINRGSGAVTNLYGVSGTAEVYDGFAAPNLAALYGYTGVEASSSTATNQMGLKIDLYNASGTTTTNRYGIYLAPASGGGTVNNRWAFYSAGSDRSYFGGNVGIGTTLPNASLSLGGALSFNHLYADATGTAGYGTLFTKTDGRLYYRNATGTAANLISSASTPSNGQVLTWNGTTSGWEALASGGGSPAGSDGQLQFKSGSSFAASANLTWNSSANRLGIGTATPTADIGFGGAVARTVEVGRNSAANTAGVDLTIQAGSATPGSTDKKGGDLILSTGIGTGHSDYSASDIIFKAGYNNGAVTATTDVPPAAVMSLGFFDQGIPQIKLGDQSEGDGSITVAFEGYNLYESQSTTEERLTTPHAPSILLKNKNATNDSFSSLEFEATNSNGNGQLAYVAAVATAGGGVYSPTIVLGTSTSATSRTERMRIDSSGNVGIGTTIPARLLHVAGPMRLTAGTLPTATVAGDIAVDSAAGNTLKFFNGTAWISAASTGGGSPAGSDGQLQFKSGTSFAASANLSWNNSATRLGIGTSNPQYALEVVNGIQRLTNSDLYIAREGASVYPQLLNTAVSTNGNAQWIIQRARGTAFGSPAAAADADYIGQLSGRAHNGSQYEDAAGIFFGVDGTNVTGSGNHPGGRIDFVTRGTSFASQYGSGLTAMSIRNNGHVGIGTTVPSVMLHLLAGDITLDESSNQQRSINLRRSGSGVGELSTESTMLTLKGSNNRPVRVVDDSNNGIFVKDGGDVGIGMTLPNAQLTLAGAMSFNQLYADAAGTAGYNLLFAKTDGKLYYRNGTGAATDLTAGGGSPAGIDGSLQFKSGTSLAGSSLLVWNNTTTRLGIGTNSPNNILDVSLNGNNRLQIAPGITAMNGTAVQVGQTQNSVYTPTSSGNDEPSAAELEIANFGSVTNSAAFLKWSVGNGRGDAYMGAINPVSGSIPTIVLGVSTDTNAYAERLRISTEGNLGIGTTVPGSRLAIRGATSDDTTSSLDVQNAAGTSMLLVNNNGQILVGVTDPHDAKLAVGGENNQSYPTIGTWGGAVHIMPTTGTNGNTSSLTFGANNSGSVDKRAQAGIYVQSSAAYGSRMHLATSDSYATGSKSRVTILENGNVGIGTTLPNANLTLTGAMSFNHLFTNATGATGFATLFAKTDGKLYYRNGTGTITDLTAGGGSSPAGSDGQLQFKSGSSFGADSALTWNSTTNSLGVNTTTTIYPFIAEADQFGFMQKNGSMLGGVWAGHDPSIGSSVQFGTSTNHPLGFFTNYSDAQMVLLTNGNVGIGNSLPLTKLHVENGAIRTDDSGTNTSPSLLIGDSDTGFYGNGGTINVSIDANTAAQLSNTSWDIYRKIRATNGDSAEPNFSFVGDSNTGMHNPASDSIGFSTGGTEKMRITFNGTIGIGTTAPAHMLHVYKNGGDNTALMRVEEFGSTGDAAMMFRVGNSNSFTMGITNSDNKFKIANGQTLGGAGDILTIEAAGDVGIGTTMPADTLEVVGRVKANNFSANTQSITLNNATSITPNGSGVIFLTSQTAASTIGTVVGCNAGTYRQGEIITLIFVSVGVNVVLTDTAQATATADSMVLNGSGNVTVAAANTGSSIQLMCVTIGATKKWVEISRTSNTN